MIEQVFAAVAPYGMPGLIIAYFAWRDDKRDKIAAERDKRLETILTENAEADKQVAVAMTVLAERLR